MGVSYKEKPRSGGVFFSELARCSRDVRISDVVHRKRKETELEASSGGFYQRQAQANTNRVTKTRPQWVRSFRNALRGTHDAKLTFVSRQSDC
jgi:hypothetical protein